MLMIISRVLAIVLVICAVCLVVRSFLYRTALIHVVRKWVRWLDDRIHVHQHLRVPELNQYGQPNSFYLQVYLYLNSLPSLEDSDFTNLFSGRKPNDILLHLDDGQVIHDTFLGASLSWTNHVASSVQQPPPPHHHHHHHLQQQHHQQPLNEIINVGGSTAATSIPRPQRSFVLKIKRKDKRRILRPYLQHIHAVSDDIQQRTNEIKLFINTSASGCGSCSSQVRRWTSTPFSHPSTFDTLVMDADLKNKIKSDLDTFLKSEHYYHRLGRVWKRSYLLYGPSGTGKSSFIAAMANYLSFDVYDVDLSRAADDSDLKMLLLQTTRKSIIVIEDLDRFFFANDQEESSMSGRRTTIAGSGLSLPGLLNFMDGIVNSSCADERIMVFTLTSANNIANVKEQLDSSLLRPGRIDVHLHFPACDFSSFKSLANNYLGLRDHKLFPQVQEMFDGGATMSPAEIGELMLLHRSSPSRALKSVITALQSCSADNRRSCESQPSPLTTSSTGDHPAFGPWKETAAAKEIRKLYGLLRLKSSKKSGPLDQDLGFVVQR